MLAHDHARHPGGLFGTWLGSTLGMVAADALAIVVGHQLGAAPARTGRADRRRHPLRRVRAGPPGRGRRSGRQRRQPSAFGAFVPMETDVVRLRGSEAAPPSRPEEDPLLRNRASRGSQPPPAVAGGSGARTGASRRCRPTPSPPSDRASPPAGWRWWSRWPPGSPTCHHDHPAVHQQRHPEHALHQRGGVLPARRHPADQLGHGLPGRPARVPRPGPRPPPGPPGGHRRPLQPLDAHAHGARARPTRRTRGSSARRSCRRRCRSTRSSASCC